MCLCGHLGGYKELVRNWCVGYVIVAFSVSVCSLCWWVFCTSCECVYLWIALAGAVMRCADGEQEGVDTSLQVVVCF